MQINDYINHTCNHDKWTNNGVIQYDWKYCVNVGVIAAGLIAVVDFIAATAVVDVTVVLFVAVVVDVAAVENQFSSLFISHYFGCFRNDVDSTYRVSIRNRS